MSITVDTAFRKDLPCRGVLFLPSTPSDSSPKFSPLPGRMAEWARIQPLACGSLTQGSLVRRSPTSVYQTTLLDCGHLLHTPSLFNLFPSSRTRKWKLQTKGPLATPSQVSGRRDLPIDPIDGSTLGSWFGPRELAPRGMSETTHHHSSMATHPCQLQIS